MILSKTKLSALFIFIIGIVLVPKKTFACSCAGGSSFFSTIQYSSSVDLIVHGKVHSHHKQSNKLHHFPSAKLEIIEVLQGEETNNIRVWEGGIGSCTLYGSSFPIGTEWVMALHKVSPYNGRSFPASNLLRKLPFGLFKQETDYGIPVCGTYTLQVVDDNVRGAISKWEWEFDPVTKKRIKRKPQTLSLEKLKTIISILEELQ